MWKIFLSSENKLNKLLSLNENVEIGSMCKTRFKGNNCIKEIV